MFVVILTKYLYLFIYTHNGDDISESVESLMHTVVSVACDSCKQQQLLSLTMLMILPLD